MRITPAQLAAHYRGYAAQCVIVAQHQHSAGDRLTLINMAQAWSALAEQTEKSASLLVVSEMPDHAAGDCDEPSH
jgi:hypothetical protein